MSAISKAKDALLRTLEQLEHAEADLGAEPERVDLIVVYSIGRGEEESWHDVGGWVSTPAPNWAKAALLRYAADAYEQSVYAKDDDEPEDE